MIKSMQQIRSLFSDAAKLTRDESEKLPSQDDEEGNSNSNTSKNGRKKLKKALAAKGEGIA